jgi:hypothetical protein
MKSLKITGITGAVALVTLLGMSASMGASAATTNHATHAVTLQSSAPKKVLVCYKGNAVKRVTTPRCPAGWTTKKPATAKTEAFAGTYRGNIALLWSATGVTATALSGAGTGTDLGLATVSGSGSSAPQSSCDPISGVGILSGGGSTLHLRLATTSKGCATDDTAPTSVTITGTATVVSGTGKFAGATGTLKVLGSFSIKSTTAGSNESDAFSATLSGALKVK